MTTTRSSRSAAPLIDSEKTAKADRVKALIARGGGLRAQGPDRSRHRRLRYWLQLDPDARRFFNARGELLAPEGRPAARAAGFRRRAEAESRHCRGESQLQVAGAGSGAARRRDRGQQQAELQLRDRQSAVEKAICANPGTGQSRPPRSTP